MDTVIGYKILFVESKTHKFQFAVAKLKILGNIVSPDVRGPRKLRKQRTDRVKVLEIRDVRGTSFAEGVSIYSNYTGRFDKNSHGNSYERSYRLIYTVGEEVTSWLDYEIDNDCSDGIHFFTSVHAVGNFIHNPRLRHTADF